MKGASEPVGPTGVDAQNYGVLPHLVKSICHDLGQKNGQKLVDLPLILVKGPIAAHHDPLLHHATVYNSRNDGRRAHPVADPRQDRRRRFFRHSLCRRGASKTAKAHARRFIRDDGVSAGLDLRSPLVRAGCDSGGTWR